MGGKGSGRKPKRETVADFKTACCKREEQNPEARICSGPQHVSKIKTSGSCRFPG